MGKWIARLALAAAGFLLLAFPSSAQTAAWQIDPAHSVAQFSVRHLMISNVTGEFRQIAGTAIWDETDVTRSRVEVIIETASLDTRVPDRDKHLRSADFFDVDHYPTMTFRSKRISVAPDGRLRMTGDLTIRGVTREVSFDVEGLTAPIRDPWGNLRVGASASARIDRKDFAMVWNQTIDGGGVLVGDEVRIRLDVEMVKQAAPSGK